MLDDAQSWCSSISDYFRVQETAFLIIDYELLLKSFIKCGYLILPPVLHRDQLNIFNFWTVAVKQNKQHNDDHLGLWEAVVMNNNQHVMRINVRCPNVNGHSRVVEQEELFRLPRGSAGKSPIHFSHRQCEVSHALEHFHGLYQHETLKDEQPC